MKDYIKDLYKKLSEKLVKSQNHFTMIKPLMTQGKLKSVGMLADILSKNRLHRLGFNIPVGKVTAQQAECKQSCRRATF